jgi:hypothetical protein
MAFADYVVPGLSAISMIETGRRADAAQASADAVNQAFMNMAAEEQAINAGIRSGILQTTANLGTSLSEGQRALGAFDPTGTGFFDPAVLNSLRAEYLAAAQRDADRALDRAASQLFAQDLRRGVASGTPGEDTRRRLMEVAADTNRDATLKARQDALNEYKSLLGLQQLGQQMEEGRRSFALDEIQGVIEPQAKLETQLLNTSGLNAMGNANTATSRQATAAASEAGEAARGFGSSLADLLRERKVDERLEKYGTAYIGD